MKFTDELVNSLFYMAPALLVFFTAYFLIKKFLDTQQRMQIAEIKETMRKEMLPLRLQAYERIVLYLERISPNNLLVRVYEPGMTVREFHKEILLNIRTEFEHNITQQVYVTNSVWNIVRNSRDELVKLINQSLEQCHPEASGGELSKKVFETMVRDNHFPVQHAIDQVKNEAHQLF